MKDKIYTLCIYLMLSIILIGCNAKKKVITKEVQKDSISTRSFEYVSQPINTQIVIDELCDSLGNVRPFKKAEISGNNSVKVNTKDNKLYLDLLTGISQVKTDTIYEYKYRDKVLTKEVLRYKTPFWIYPTFALLIGIILFLLKYTKVYSFIRKFIPF